MSTDLPQKIKDLIIKNKLKEACQLLMNTSVSKEAIGLMSRIEKLNNLILTNQISNEEATREESRITQTLLRLIEKLVDKTTLPLLKESIIINYRRNCFGSLDSFCYMAYKSKSWQN